MKKIVDDNKRMQELAGIIKEDSHLHISVGLLFHIDESIKSSINKIDIPVSDVEMTPLPNDRLHVTLTSIRNFKPFKDVFNENKSSVTEIPPPNVELGEGRFVHRSEKGKITYVLAVNNQEELKVYVDALYGALGLENPEPDRFFHITIANNMGGDPFKSIGDVKKEDFK